MERTLSSKRSGAGAALVPSGLTERQALALALEESRRAAVAAKQTAAQDEEGGGSDESSSDDESSASGARARGGSRPQPQQGAGDAKAAKRRRPRQRPGLLPAGNAKESGKLAGTPRKRARVEATEFRTATSSENSKASRTTQQLLDLGGSLRGSLEGFLNNGDAGVPGAGQRRGDSVDSEHNSISGGSGQNADKGELELGKPKQEATSEGAGESGGSEQQKCASAAPDQDMVAQLDARTIAEMALKRRERFGTSCESAAAHKPAPKPLRRAPSCAAPQQKLGGPQLEVVARSRSCLAALVESDLFPDTPRRGAAASKTATPAATPTLAPADAVNWDIGTREAAEDQKVLVCGGVPAAVSTDPGASPVRTPSPVAGSPRSLQGSEVQDADLAGDVSLKLGDVKREDAEDARQGTGPQEAVFGEQPPAPKQLKQRRRPGPSPKRPRLPALQVPRDSPDSAMLDPLVKAEGTPAARKGRLGGTANRGARSVSRTPSRKSRWASSHLGSPANGLGRRLRSAVVEEFKHNTDASDPFAWQPQTPSRARASALLAACAVLAAQDKQLSAPPTPSPRPTVPVASPSKHQQPEQEKMDAAKGCQQEKLPGSEPSGLRSADAAPTPAQQPAAGEAPAQQQPSADGGCAKQPEVAQGMHDGAPNESSAMEVDLELSVEPATPPGSPAAATARDAFTTPAHQMLRGSSVEFPALDAGASAAATPVLCTPAVTPAVKWRPPLWKKLHPLCLDLQRPAEPEQQCSGLEAPSAVATPAPARQRAFTASLPSPARACVADAAAQVCAAFKGRHGLEGRRLELSSNCAAADEPGVVRPEASPAAHHAAPFQGSRLGKALAACYGRSRASGAAAAGFSGGCGGLRAPYMRARNTPAWRSAGISRSGSAGSSCALGVNPHLARQRTQRNLQNTWDDLLARQALEAGTAEALAAWARADEPTA